MSAATATAPALRHPWWRAKNVVFAFIGLMLLYVLVHNERFLIDPNDPQWQHFEPFKWLLLPHAVGGACALLLAPMQFSDRLRRRFAKLHRIVGRIYIAGVFLSSPIGVLIQKGAESAGASRSFTVAAGVQATLWMLTTAIALVMIRKGNVQQHRQWMTRSFAVALVFLEVRVILGITGWETLGFPAIEAVVWACNAMALFLADLALQFQPGIASKFVHTGR